MTIRHLFYRLVSAGAIDKTEKAYKNLCAHLTKWRRAGTVEWSAFSDSTRWAYSATQYDTVLDALRNTVACYRKNLWLNTPVHVEIWAEKDAIASILYAEAEPWGVRVFPLRGFSSLTALYAAAEGFRERIEGGKEICIYYFGDHDPSGVAIDPTAARALREDFGVEVAFERVAVTGEQIKTFRLPTRPSKKSDSRSKTFVGESVEIDAMDPGVLRGLVADCIGQHINSSELATLRAIEDMEAEQAGRWLVAAEETW